MKKLLLSIAVVLAFVLYSGYIKTTKTISQVVFPTLVPSKIPTNTPAIQSPAQATNLPVDQPVVQPTDTPAPKQGKYKDGTYTGKSVDVFYGILQVQAVVQNGQLTDVQFLQYPNDQRQSIEINSQALPMLRQEAIQAQNAQVDIISGATDSSQGFIMSLDSALSQAI